MKYNLLALLVMTTFLSGCMATPTPVTDQNNQLTQGQVQMHLKVGETTKADVLENFGSPNVTTRDGSGQEVWTYQRQTQVSQSSAESSYGTIILFGAKSKSKGFESTSRMMTLIIKFDEKDIVSDFKSRSSNF